MPQPLADFVQAGSQSIALPRWSSIHPVADFAQALAHAHTMLATAFPFLPIAGADLPIAGAALPTWPLDLNELAVDDARFNSPWYGTRADVIQFTSECPARWTVKVSSPPSRPVRVIATSPSTTRKKSVRRSPR
jgi:hypothetical protein